MVDSGEVRGSRSKGARTGSGSVESGFTLLELLIVMTIIATLAAMAIPAYTRNVKLAKEAVLREDLQVLPDRSLHHVRQQVDVTLAVFEVRPRRMRDRLGQRLLGDVRIGADRRELGEDRLSYPRRLGEQVPDGDGAVGGVAPARSRREVVADRIVEPELVLVVRDPREDGDDRFGR